MKLVFNIITSSRGGSFQDVVKKFIINNKHLSPYVDTDAIIQRIDEVYQQHCKAIPKISYNSDYMMNITLFWISDNKYGYNGCFKYVILSYKTTYAKSIDYKYCLPLI